MVAPFIAAGLFAGTAAYLMYSGFLLSTASLKFALKNIDPIQGTNKIFRTRALVELLESLLKIVLMVIVTLSVIWIYKDDMMMLAFKNTDVALAFFGKITRNMGISAIIALLFLAVFDYAYQRYDFEKNMKMSKQDIKDEHKNMEGDPFIKSKRKEKQHQISLQHMKRELSTNDF